jgi:putative phage-type endonuclease
VDKTRTRIIQCQCCPQRLRIPVAAGQIRVRCTRCGSQWLLNTGTRPPYRVVDLAQGTEEWRAWRDQGLGASDAPVVMEESPWKNPAQLLEEKRFGRRLRVNPAMARGTALEPEARRRYEKVTGTTVLPLCLQSTNYEWLRASVDGLSDDGKSVVEIKCGERVYRESASTRRVPAYYIGQLQHTLAVTGLEEIYFWCYLPGRPEVHLVIQRDQSYIDRLLVAEERFWRDLQKGLK